MYAIVLNALFLHVNYDLILLIDQRLIDALLIQTTNRRVTTR